jgi:hypothetical protein
MTKEISNDSHRPILGGYLPQNLDLSLTDSEEDELEKLERDIEKLGKMINVDKQRQQNNFRNNSEVNVSSSLPPYTATTHATPSSGSPIVILFPHILIFNVLQLFQ